MKFGDYFSLDAARRELRGDFRTAPRLYFWNVAGWPSEREA